MQWVQPVQWVGIALGADPLPNTPQIEHEHERDDRRDGSYIAPGGSMRHPEPTERYPEGGTARHSDYGQLFRSLVRRMVLVSALPLLIAGATSSYLFYGLNRRIVVEQHSHLVRHHRDSIEAFLRGRTAELGILANQYSLDELLGGDLERVFRVIQERNEIFTDVGIVDSDGRHLTYLGPFDLVGRNYRDAPWFAEVMERGVYISDVFEGFRAVPHFIIAVRRQEGERSWILRATINSDFFGRLVEGARSGRTGEFFLINRAGLQQTRTASGGALLSPSGYPDLRPHAGIRVRELSMQGRRYLCTTTWLDDPEWLLVFRQDLAEVYGPLRRASAIGLLILVASALGASVLALVVARGQTRYIQQSDREKATLAQRLVAAGKTAAVGEMSAGLAHEINNPLATVDALQTWIRDLVAVGPVPEEDRREIEDAARKIGEQVVRCKVITQGLLKFSRRVESRVEPVELNALLGELCTMARSRARIEGVTLDTDFAANPSIVSSASHLQQIIMNLVNNALDAVAGLPNARVLVSSRVEGEQVRVIVADNGPGIPPENLSRVFLPFFTTK
ncbi:MAG: ATP-binding protein, partial [Pseudomonadota bacterium]